MSDRFATVELLARRAEQLAAGDPQATRLVYAIVIGLVIVGVVLLVIAIWMLRRTKADMELLGPLERMSDSKWRKSNPDARRALLDEVRPDGAVVPTPVLEVAASGAVLPPPTLPESDPVVDSDPAVDSDPVGADPVVESEPVIEPESVVEPEPVVESKPVVEPDPVIESDPVVEPESVVEPEPVVESERVVESEPEPAAEAVATPDPDSVDDAASGETDSER